MIPATDSTPATATRITPSGMDERTRTRRLAPRIHNQHSAVAIRTIEKKA
jgi:hypothetical protein